MKGIDTKAGVIDAEYRGEIKVLLQNDNDHEFHFTREKPIAQIVFMPIALPKVQKVTKNLLSHTDRGDKGFGSSDKPQKQEPQKEKWWNTEAGDAKLRNFFEKTLGLKAKIIGPTAVATKSSHDDLERGGDFRVKKHRTMAKIPRTRQDSTMWFQYP